MSKASAQSSILESVRAFLSNNRLSLRDLCILNLSGGSNFLLSEVQNIVSLRHLALDGWIDPSGSRLRQIFQDCRNLQSLSLAMNSLSLDEITFGELAEAPFPTTSIRRLVLDRSTVNMDLLINLARCMPHLKDLSLANTYGFSHSTSHDESSAWSDSDEEVSDDSDLDDHDIFESYEDNYSDRSQLPSVVDTYTGEGSPVTSFTGEDVVLDPAPFSPTDDVDVVSSASHESADVSFAPASGLADTTESLGEWSYGEEDKLRQLHQLCPDIISFDFTGCKSDGVDDAMLTTICQLWGTNGLQTLKFGGVCQFWDSTFSTIAQYCSRTLTVLELSSRNHTPAQFVFVQFDPMARVLLESCRALEVLRIDSYPIRAGDIGYEPWQCSNLNELGIWIDEYERNRDDYNRDRGQGTVRTNAYRQLGRLKRLRTLALTGSEPFLLRTKSTPSPTDFSDWQLWADLHELEVLDVTNLDPSALSELALGWIGEHWTGLKTVTGSFLPVRITEQFKSLGAILTKRLSYSRRGRSRESGPGPTPQTAIELLPDIDPVTNVGLSKFRKSRPDVDLGAYMDAFDQCLKSNGLEVAPVSESARENRDPRRRCVQKIISATQEPVTRPGGRDNSEFMADVMRPRGGRSPSPLGTWHLICEHNTKLFWYISFLKPSKSLKLLLAAWITGIPSRCKSPHLLIWLRLVTGIKRLSLGQSAISMDLTLNFACCTPGLADCEASTTLEACQSEGLAHGRYFRKIRVVAVLRPPRTWNMSYGLYGTSQEGKEGEHREGHSDSRNENRTYRNAYRQWRLLKIEDSDPHSGGLPAALDTRIKLGPLGRPCSSGDPQC
ncbi:hypothetical protein BGZ92_000056 [Podila epicladia]|nr:hypothetical protein BGZ92_000056 [Podila epicladia]